MSRPVTQSPRLHLQERAKKSTVHSEKTTHAGPSFLWPTDHALLDILFISMATEKNRRTSAESASSAVGRRRWCLTFEAPEKKGRLDARTETIRVCM